MKLIDVSESNSSDEWIAAVSGLDVGSLSPSDAQIQMLVEYLSGEAGGIDDQVSASQISRLIIAGDSLAPPALTAGEPLLNIEDRKAVCLYLVSHDCSSVLTLTYLTAAVWI
jgi:DNA polymerase delta subunit 2